MAARPRSTRWRRLCRSAAPARRRRSRRPSCGWSRTAPPTSPAPPSTSAAAADPCAPLPHRGRGVSLAAATEEDEFMDPTATRELGRTGVALTQLGFGGAPLGELFTKVSEADAEATLAAAWAAGIRYYDTAPWYGRGQSEHRTGRFLYRQKRQDLVLSTKIGRILRAPADTERFDTGFWSGGLHFEHRFDYSYDGVMRAFEDSLQRLGMTRIDLLLIHDLDFWHHATEPKVSAYLAQLFTG